MIVLCEFSQDPERIPRAWLESPNFDRVFCGNLGIGVVRECVFVLVFHRSPKGSHTHGRRLSLTSWCCVKIRDWCFKGVFVLCEVS